MIFGGGDLFDTAAGHGAVGLLLSDAGIFRAAGVFVFFLDEEPVRFAVLAAEAVAMHAHKHPVAVHFCAVEGEFEIALAQAFLDIDERLPRALIPNHDGATAVLSLWD